MTQYTGNVRVKDGTKAPQEYGVNREVEINVAFVANDDDALSAAVNHAGKVANDKVEELLGRTATDAAKPAASRKAATAKPPTAPKEEKKQEAAKPAADPAAIGGEPTVAPAEKQAIQTGGERIDSNAKPDPAGMDDVLAPVAPSTITDSHLMSAITRRNAETSNALAIRTLIGKYVPQDGAHHGAADIEQGKRQAFLLELDKVEKAKA